MSINLRFLLHEAFNVYWMFFCNTETPMYGFCTGGTAQKKPHYAPANHHAIHLWKCPISRSQQLTNHQYWWADTLIITWVPARVKIKVLGHQHRWYYASTQFKFDFWTNRRNISQLNSSHIMVYCYACTFIVIIEIAPQTRKHAQRTTVHKHRNAEYKWVIATEMGYKTCHKCIKRNKGQLLGVKDWLSQIGALNGINQL